MFTPVKEEVPLLVYLFDAFNHLWANNINRILQSLMIITFILPEAKVKV